MGAYTYALLSSPHLMENFEWIAAAFPDGVHNSIRLVVPLGAALAAFFCVLLGAPVLRLRGDYLAIVTLGFGEIIRIFLNNLNAPLNITNGPQRITNIDPVRTALENVMVGRHARTGAGAFGAVFRTAGQRREEPQIRQRALGLLEYAGIARYADFQARTLSYGDQRRLEIARALATDPKLLALDEPSMGLSPIMVERVFEVVRDVAAQGTTILLVEQNARLALESASRAYVTDSGLVTMSGDACAMPDDPRVRAACPGEEAAA